LEAGLIFFVNDFHFKRGLEHFWQSEEAFHPHYLTRKDSYREVTG
jgi:hypothetical protein